MSSAELEIAIVADTASLDAAIEKAKSRLSSMSATAKSEYASLDAVERRRAETLFKQADTIDMARREQILYNAALSGMPTQVLEDLKRRMQSVQTATNGAVMGQKQYNAALRGVPAQITDIFTSLQGGQAPLTVLIQQGGQLKDMFGGVKEAAGALGVEMAKIITPTNLAIGAAIGLAVAFAQGASEAGNFQKVITQFNGRLGVSVQQLQGMSAALAVNGTSQREAAAALVEVASSGSFVGEQLQVVAEAAINLQATTGKAIGETVKSFEKMKEKPVEAAIELNKQLNFLTRSLYEQMKVLEEQGDLQSAYALGMEAAARASSDMREAMVADLHGVELAWRSLLTGASAAIDFMRDAGRPQTGADRLAVIQGELSRIDKMSDTRKKQMQAYITSLEEQRETIIRAETASIQETGQKVLAAQIVQDQIDTDKLVKQWATKEEKREKQLEQVREQFRQRRKNAEKAGNYDDIMTLNTQEDLVVGNMKDSWKEKEKKAPKPKKERKPSDTETGAAMLKQVQQQITLNDAAALSEERLSASQTLNVRAKALLNDSQSKLTKANREALEVALPLLLASGASAEAALKEASARKRLAEEARKHAETVKELLGDIAFETSLVWLDNNERERAIALRQANADAASEEGVKITEALGKLQEAREAQRLFAGLKSELEDFATIAVSGTGNAADAFEDMVDRMKAAAVRFLAEKAVQAVLKMFMTKTVDTRVDGAGGGGADFSNYAAKGATFSGGAAQFFAKGGAFSNGIVSSATPFRFGRGGSFGVMGEAGPEAIMPLKRSANGSLGVAASGGGSGVTIVVENHSDGPARTEQSQGAGGEDIIRVIVDAAVGEVDRRISGMGSTGQTIGRRFGVNAVGVRRG